MSEPECAFCDLIASGKVKRESVAIVSFEPLGPVTAGHRLFVATEHTRDLSVKPALTGRVFKAASKHARKMGEDCNLISSMGEHATQTIKHTHVHYVPRRKNDGLHLPWTNQLRKELEQ